MNHSNLPLSQDFSLEPDRAGSGTREDTWAELFLERAQTLRLEARFSRGEANVSRRFREGFGIRWVKGRDQHHFFEEGLDMARILEMAGRPRPPGGGKGQRSWHRRGRDSDEDFSRDGSPWEAFSGLVERVRSFAGQRLPVDTRIVAEWRRREIQVAQVGEKVRSDARERVVLSFITDPPTRRSFGFGVESLESSADPHQLERHLQPLAPRPGQEERRQSAPAGEGTVVLAPGTGGVFLHEACGHGLEGDLVLRRGSPFRDRSGERVAPDFVEVVDDPSRPALEGSYAFDDEGAPAQPTVLIEKGILRNFLTDRVTAHLLKRPVTGNGRRESFRDLPLPRMSNLYLKPGPHSAEGIFRDTSRGIFVEALRGGRVDPSTGDFLFRVEAAHLIESGRLTAPLHPFWIAGNGLRALAAIDRVGHDLSFGTGAGSCGKDGQQVPVGVGLPTLRVQALLIRPD